MNQDSRIYKWMLKQQKKNDLSEGMSTGFKHRAAYHKEFVGYSEIRIPESDGRYKIKRVYVAPWNVHSVSDRTWILMKILYALSVIISAGLLITTALMDNELNYSKITGAAQCFSAISLVVYTARVIIFLATPRKMTNGQCNNVDRPFTRWSMIAFICYLALCVWSLVFLLFFRQSGSFISVSAPFFLLIPGTASLFLVWLFQSRLKYHTVINENTVDENDESYMIK